MKTGIPIKSIPVGVNLLLALLAGFVARAEPQRVLLINSFGREFAPYDAFAGTLRTELIRQSPHPLDIYEVSLESARFNAEPQGGPTLEYLRTLFEGRDLDLIVPIGGPAVRFAQRCRPELFPGKPMLLAAVDERHLQPDLLTTNDTAVPVSNNLHRVIQHILTVLPQTTNVGLVIGASPLERFWQAELDRAIAPLTNQVRFESFHSLSLPEMIQRSSNLPPQSAIFYGMLAMDAQGVPQTEARALTQLREAATAPIFGLYESQLGRGIVGGPLISLDQLGRDTAAVALRILHGEPPGSIHVPALQAGTPIYDWRELQRWDIRESRLPLGSEVRFRQPNLWQAHRPRIVAVALLGLLSLLVIGVLLLALGKRRRAERLLRESEDRLNVAMAAGNVGVWAWTVSTNQIWASENWRRIFGFAPDAALSYETALARIHPEDRPGVGSALQKAIAEQSDYYGEFRVVHPAGELRWIAARARLRADRPGREPSRLVGAAVDITERKHAEQTAREFGGRLLHAQEADRARLARELHDDITQRLARLAIDAGRAETGTTDPRHKELMREVRDGLVRLSEDVHSLSYQLHPALLEDLGLTDALQAEAERFQKQEALAVDMKLAPLPERIPRDTGLCLYRVTQEALRNVARHAGTRRATVSLRPLDGGLQLAVSDPGVGFDPARQRRPSLGLASMQERVRLLGGDLDIESSPGHGTQIVAWVPLPDEMP